MKNELNKMTAVQWLIEDLGGYFPHGVGGIELMVKKAKEMEKEQQKYFFDCGRQYQLTGEGTFNQVHDETYGGNK